MIICALPFYSVDVQTITSYMASGVSLCWAAAVNAGFFFQLLKRC